MHTEYNDECRYSPAARDPVERRKPPGSGCMAIRVAQQAKVPVSKKEGVRIIWKGMRIAKLIFASGKVVEFT